MTDDVCIIGDSETNADLYYATQFLVGDPVVFCRLGGKRILALNDLEVDRGRASARVDEVISTSELCRKLGKERAEHDEILAALLDEHGVKEVSVQPSFPLLYADRLRARGYKLVPRPGQLFPERVLKREDELAKIRAVQAAVERAVARAEELLRNSGPDSAGVMHAPSGPVLTAEELKRVVNQSLIGEGCIATHTIVAPGEQAVDPHNRGSGPVRKSEPIVFDVFPRSADNGYWADMSRTFIWGPPSDALQRQYDAVLEAQEAGIQAIRAGGDGRDVHMACVGVFDRLGYKTGVKDGRMQGFFHGTGHGVGLEIHEAPRVAKVEQKLEAGMVITVEPGLYYKGTGGVRIEDMLVVRDGKAENMSGYHKRFRVDR